MAARPGTALPVNPALTGGMAVMRKSNFLLFTAVGAFAFGTAARAQSFDYTGAETSFTAPTTGIYDITAFGAAGGSGNGGSWYFGAEVGGDFNLTAGTVLTILAGGAGGVGNGIGANGAAGGGGGGSFVVTSTNAPLVIAGGGGGGGGLALIPSNGDGGTTSTSGDPSLGGNVGGSGGSGGAVNGGGGFSGNGGSGGGASFLSGGAGGTSGGGDGGL